MKQDIKDIVITYVELNDDLNYTEIADLIIEDGAIDKAHRTLRRYVKEVSVELEEANAVVPPPATAQDSEEDKSMQDPTVDAKISSVFDTESLEKQLEKVKEEDTSYCWPSKRDLLQCPDDNDMSDLRQSVIDLSVTSEDSQGEIDIYDKGAMIHEKFTVDSGSYTTTYQRSQHVFAAETVDLVYCAYSKKGMNLTKHQIIEMLGMSSEEFNCLTNRLGLSKESLPYGPYTEEFFAPEDLYKVVQSCTSELITLEATVDSSVVETLIRETKKQRAELASKNLLMDRFINRLEERIENLDIKPIKVKPIDKAIPTMTVIITDTHIGLQTEDYNRSVVMDQFQIILEDITLNRVEGQKVVVVFLGDTIHSISGVQHPDMWQRIEEGAWGADIIIDTFEMITSFLLEVPGLSNIYAIGGSHDRIIPDKHYEAESQGSKLVFYMLQRVMSARGIEVSYKDHLNIFDEGNIRFICVHGDQGLDKKPAQEIAWMKGDQNKFNLILEGHYHTFYVPKNDTSKNFMKLHCPSFCAQDQFADKLGLDSLDGYVVVTEKRGLPSIAIEPLNY